MSTNKITTKQEELLTKPNLDEIKKFETFKYLLLNEPNLNPYHIYDKKLSYFTDKTILETSLKKIEFYPQNKFNEKTIQIINEIYYEFINSKPLIKDFNSIFNYVAEKKWNSFREENFELFTNIFRQICTELRNSSSKEEVFTNLLFIPNMGYILEDKYEILYKAMIEYFDIYHSNTKNKIERSSKSKDLIADLSALYIAKSKENYKLDVHNNQYKWLKKFYTLNLENPYIKKRLIQTTKKQKFKELLQTNDEEISKFISSIKEKYTTYIDEEVISKMITDFLDKDYFKIEKIINEPTNYTDYKRYLKALKLVNRLNSNYIKYLGVEMQNYKDIISYDTITKKYIYTGKKFNEKEISSFKDYESKTQIFDLIKKDLTNKINTITYTYQPNPDLEEKLIEELPFNDEYFTFNSTYVYNEFDFKDFIMLAMIRANPSSFEKEENIEILRNLLINNCYLWLLLFNYRDDINIFDEIGVSRADLTDIINNISNTIPLANQLKIDLTDFSNLVLIHKISKFTDINSISILGIEIIEKLSKSTSYTIEEPSIVIRKSKELVCQMIKKDISTVPYIKGQNTEYNYSLYDSQDNNILTSGIDTDSCLRISGNDNDFFHYCAINPNGFIIQIRDNYGNFIAKVAGFRNGNCIFLNQLRTIYEAEDYFEDYDKIEINKIINTLEQACQDIINISQNNEKESIKIEHIFITKSYALKNTMSNVWEKIETTIGKYPMNTSSKDWREFITTTKNLTESIATDRFTTDYSDGDYPLICLASTKDKNNILSEDIKKGYIPPLYQRPRTKITASILNSNTVKYANKIKAINCYYDMTEFSLIDISKNSIIITGDNWYIIYNNEHIIDSCVLDFDTKAKKEYQITKQVLKEYLTKKGLNNNNIIKTIETKIKTLKKD